MLNFEKILKMRSKRIALYTQIYQARHYSEIEIYGLVELNSKTLIL